MITESPRLLACEQQILAGYTASLARLLGAETSADPDDIEAWVAANAMMGVDQKADRVHAPKHPRRPQPGPAPSRRQGAGRARGLAARAGTRRLRDGASLTWVGETHRRRRDRRIVPTSVLHVEAAGWCVVWRELEIILT